MSPLHGRATGPASVDDVYASTDLSVSAPTNRFPAHEIDPRHAYAIVHDDLMLEGNPRLNLATFCTTWLEPETRALLDEAVDRNIVDKDEYPQTAEIEARCVRMLADLWNAPSGANPTGKNSLLACVSRANCTSVQPAPRMNIHEYQAKELLQKFGAATPAGKVAGTAEEAEQIARELGTNDLVVKAQVHAGGRGKGTFANGFKGGVHLVKSPAEAREVAAKMLGQTLVTHQTGAAGRVVNKVLIAVSVMLFSDRDVAPVFGHLSPLAGVQHR